MRKQHAHRGLGTVRPPCWWSLVDHLTVYPPVLINQAMCHFVFHQWYAPLYHRIPGQLVSSYFCKNEVSGALHHKLGFINVALSDERIALNKKGEEIQVGAANGDDVEDEEEEVDKALYCCVWTGPEGTEVLSKEETIFKDLPSA